jgi:hypothetical protein
MICPQTICIAVTASSYSQSLLRESQQAIGLKPDYATAFYNRGLAQRAATRTSLG